MPTLVVVVKIDRPSHSNLDFHSYYISSDELSARDLASFAQSKQGCHDRHRMMPSHHAAEVIIVKCVRRHSVHEGGIQRTGATVRPEDERSALRLGHPGNLQQDLRAVLS